jgi:hypothetical protein
MKLPFGITRWTFIAVFAILAFPIAHYIFLFDLLDRERSGFGFLMPVPLLLQRLTEFGIVIAALVVGAKVALHTLLKKRVGEYIEFTAVVLYHLIAIYFIVVTTRGLYAQIHATKAQFEYAKATGDFRTIPSPAKK